MKLPDWAARMARAFAEEFRASVALVARASIMLLVGGAILALASQGNLYSPTTGTVSGLGLTNNYNSAIDAVNTMNSGSSSPANQLSGSPSLGNWWIDTSVSPNRVRVYDGSSWLIVGYIDPTNHVYVPVTGGGTSNLASAATADLCSVPQTFLTITGTTGITSFGSSCAVGQVKVLTFSGIVALTNSSSLILPTGANVTTAAGDNLVAVNEGSGIWLISFYQRASGAPLVPYTLPAVCVIKSTTATTCDNGPSYANNGVFTPPAGARYLKVEMVGGGGGGQGGGTTNPGGGAGGPTTFGTSLLTANGGVTSCGTLPTATGGDVNFQGNPGGQTSNGGGSVIGGIAGNFGGASFFGGGGAGGGFTGGSSYLNGLAGSAPGSGGGGGVGNAASDFNGCGGSSGAYLRKLLTSLSGTYNYAIGAGGTAGSAGTNGTAGGAGAGGEAIIEIGF